MEEIEYKTLDFESDKLNFKIISYTMILVGMIYLGHKDFMVYHNIVEMFGVIIGFAMLIISINTYKLSTDNRMIFLGIIYGFVASFDLMHLFTYEGMVIFNQDGFDLSIKLWTAARYIQSISFLIAFILPRKRFNLVRVFFTYLAISVLFLLSIFYFNIIPNHYIDGIGFTLLKHINGYIICGVLFISILYFLEDNYDDLNKGNIFIIMSLIASILCQICFNNSYIKYDLLSILGHAFQLISFYFIYISLIQSSLKQPHYDLIKLNKTLNNNNKSLENLICQLESEYEQKKILVDEKIRKKEILKGILESSGDGIFVIDNDRNIIHFNNKFMEMFNIPSGVGFKGTDHKIVETIKKQIYNPEQFDEDIKKEWESEGKYIYYLYFKNGKIFEMCCFSFIDKDIDKGKVITCKDITEEKKIKELRKDIEIKQIMLEKAKEFDELKDGFLCTVSHEFKTPINIILGITQLLPNISKNSEDYRKGFSSDKYINIMKQNCYRLIKLSDNLIDITKIDSGFMSMNFENRNIVSVIEDITLSVGEYIESKGILLIFDTDTEEQVIACDVEKLERVMLNLLSNAIKFIQNEGKIEVNIEHYEEYVSISVKDNGIGIPEDMMEIIFDRFKQVDSSLRRRKEGSGIGLSLVKSIVELHKGKISLKSEIGKGSEFIIELPISLVNSMEGANEMDLTHDVNVDRINIEFSDIYELNNFE